MVCSLCPRARSSRETPAEVEQRRDGPVLVMHEGVTNSNFAHLIPAQGVDFPSCRKVVKMSVEDLDNLGYHRVPFQCDDEPFILALLTAVKWAWTGDVVQETSASGWPAIQRCCRKFSKCHQQTCQINQTGSGRMQPACTVSLRWVETARQRVNEMWEGALVTSWGSSVSEFGGCLCSHPTVLWVHWIHDLNKEGTWGRWMDRTQCLLALPVEW